MPSFDFYSNGHLTSVDQIYVDIEEALEYIAFICER